MKRVLLFGRKKWSMFALKQLIENDYDIIGVVGRPASSELDGNQGSLLDFARDNNITIYDYKEVYSLIDEDNMKFDGKDVDIIISYLFWGKLKPNLLKIAKVASVNLHPGPLPDYQGLGGYNAAILDDKSEYGVTAHLMNQDIDSGDILKIKTFKVSHEETAFSLEQKSMKYLFELFNEVFINDKNNLKNMLKDRQLNDSTKGRYINREEFEAMKIINDNDSTDVVNKKIRAFWYPPYEGAKIKIGNHYYTVVDQSILKEIGNFYHE